MKIIKLFIIVLVIFYTPLSLAVTEQSINKALERVKKEKYNPDAYFNLAILYSQTPYLYKTWWYLKKTYDLDRFYFFKVIKHNQNILKQKVNNIESLYKIAIIYCFIKDYDKAINILNNIIELYPNFVWAYNYLGFIYLENNNLDKAIEILLRALTIDSNNSLSHLLLGQVYYKQNLFIAGYNELNLGLKLQNDFKNSR